MNESVSQRRNAEQLKEDLSLADTSSGIAVTPVGKSKTAPHGLQIPNSDEKVQPKTLNFDKDLIGESLESNTSDAQTGDSQSVHSSDLERRDREENKRLKKRFGVDNLETGKIDDDEPEPLDEEVDSFVDSLIEEVVQYANSSSDASESSGSFSSEKSSAVSVASDSSAGTPHASVEVGNSGPKIVRKGNEYHKKLETQTEKEDTALFYSLHDDLKLTPKKGTFTSGGAHGTFVTEALPEGFITLREYIDKKMASNDDERYQIRRALFKAFRKVKGSWNDIINATNIAVRKTDSGKYEVKFFEGGHYNGMMPGSPNNRARVYMIDLYDRERKRGFLPDVLFKSGKKRQV